MIKYVIICKKVLRLSEKFRLPDFKSVKVADMVIEGVIVITAVIKYFKELILLRGYKIINVLQPTPS